MARIAMVAPLWVGHLNPMTTLGRALQRRGHDVTLISFPGSEARAAQTGLESQTIGTGIFPQGDWDRRARELSVRHGLAAGIRAIRWLDDMTRAYLQDLPKTLDNYDGLVMDQIAFGVETVAQRMRIPLAVACNALPVHFYADLPAHSETWAYRTGPLARARNRIVHYGFLLLGRRLLKRVKEARHGQPWNVWQQLNEAPPSLVQVAQLPACLDFPRRNPPARFHHTGPWHEPSSPRQDGFAWSWLDGRPLIYSSLGTLQNGLDHLYQIILDACAELPVQTVLCLGRENGHRPKRIPANAQVLGYGPQLALLQRASLVITHAGLNTTLETLAQGLPIVALPIAHEQPGIAARIRHAGVGDWLSIRGLTAARLRRFILRVQNDPACRKQAQACAEEIKKADGLATAAALIEQAILEKKPIPGPPAQTS